MGVTAFLSMWINNAAATSIMLAVVLAITRELEGHQKGFHEKRNALKVATSAANGKLPVQIFLLTKSVCVLSNRSVGFDPV